VDDFSQQIASSTQAPTLSAAAAAAADKENVSALIQSTDSNRMPLRPVQSKMTAFFSIEKSSTTAKKRKQSEVSFYRCSNDSHISICMHDQQHILHEAHLYAPAVTVCQHAVLNLSSLASFLSYH
jgi:hypothetical protein